MGRYLDLAADVIAELGIVSQYEINELNEKTSTAAPVVEARPGERVVLLHCPPGVPEEWVQGVADLLAMACPASCPAERWKVLREDAYHFLRDHAARAHELDWTALDLFGVYPVKPWARFDCMGLVPLLNGARVTALSGIEAVIEKPNGAQVTFRKRHDLSEVEICPLWGLL